MSTGEYPEDVGMIADERLNPIWALRHLSDVMIACVVGAVLYVAYIEMVVVHARVMPVTHARLIGVSNAISVRAGACRGRSVFVFGSSVTIEGVDCKVIDGQIGPEYKSFNIGWTGAQARHFVLMLDRVIRCSPALVVLDVDPISVPTATAIPTQLLCLAGYWGLLPIGGAPYSVLLKPEEQEVVDGSIVDFMMSFRSFPVDAIDSYFREVTRADLRFEGYESNLMDPWIRKERVSESAFERSLNTFVDSFESGSEDSVRETCSTLEFLIEYFHTQKIQVLVVISPMHPILSERIGGPGLKAVVDPIRNSAESHGAMFVDHSGLLHPDEFSDGIHPFGPGRARWSCQLGLEVARTLSEKSKNE